MIRIVCFVFIITCLSCGDRGKKTENPVSQPLKPGSLTGNIVKDDPELDEVISVETKAEVLAAGFDWSEGPLWLEDQQKLIFSDIPNNRIYEWTALKGKQIYLEPSGYTKEIPAENGESGSNGLTFDREGKLLICQHGDRRVVRMDVGLDNPAARFTTWLQHLKEKNSTARMISFAVRQVRYILLTLRTVCRQLLMMNQNENCHGMVCIK
ncbi:MAG: SMP-30/gluconolactonase/LRE family protein [Saprospiraceae bacterium]|nr:SMP-30/gluconolactonase/LRE family protein [Saprospiraceae bacterium]